MIKLLKMTSVALAGMTLFSCLAGKFHKKSFTEPVVLNKVLYPDKRKDHARLWTGYAVHSLIGLIFSAIYKLIWDKTALKPRHRNSITGGLVNGIIGIAGWHTLFKTLHQPAIPLKKYYSQLLAAHVVFGFLNGLIYRDYSGRD